MTTIQIAEAFTTWHAKWWRNKPNPIAESNAQAAFEGGWDAAVTALTGAGLLAEAGSEPSPSECRFTSEEHDGHFIGRRHCATHGGWRDSNTGPCSERKI